MKKQKKQDYLPLSHLVTGEDIYDKWFNNKEVRECLDIWENNHNPNFKKVNNLSGLREWIDKTGAISLKFEDKELLAVEYMAFAFEEWIMVNDLMPPFPDLTFDEAMKKIVKPKDADNMSFGWRNTSKLKSKKK